mgnify:CR=1 FL=1|jgi:hypothetical protein
MNKKIIILITTLLVLALTLSFVSRDDVVIIEKVREPLEVVTIQQKPIVVTPIETPIEPLIDALIMVESMGNDSAIGDVNLGSPSIGVLQIRPVMVREVNRILKIKGTKHRFKLKDRFSREKSIEMFMVWYEFHHKDDDYERISRNWNGGPKGHKSSRTNHYWEKVSKELSK